MVYKLILGTKLVAQIQGSDFSGTLAHQNPFLLQVFLAQNAFESNPGAARLRCQSHVHSLLLLGSLSLVLLSSKNHRFLVRYALIK